MIGRQNPRKSRQPYDDPTGAPELRIYESLGVEVRECTLGRGVFVTRTFRKGQRVLQFRGGLLRFADTLAKGPQEANAFQIGPDLYLDPEPPGLFVNHSCQPNTGIRDTTWLVAVRELSAGEQVFFDYSTTMDEGHWTMVCHCAAPTCRGVIGDFKHLPRETKHERIARGVVPDFILAGELGEGRLTRPEIDRLLVRTGRA